DPRLQRLLRELLRSGVQREPHVVAGDGPLAADQAEVLPGRVDPVLDEATRAGEVALVDAFDSRDADHVPRRVVGESRILELVLRDLAEVPEDVGGRGAQ